ncbi:unnamed protein product, partial [Staurois parvus]
MYNIKRSQAGRVGSKRAGKVQGAGGRVVRNSRGRYRQSSKSGSGRKQTGCRYRGSWEQDTKALTAGPA